jgi:hypothetical protein
MTSPEPTDPNTQDQNRDAIPAGHDSDSAWAQENERHLQQFRARLEAQLETQSEAMKQQFQDYLLWLQDYLQQLQKRWDEEEAEQESFDHALRGPAPFREGSDRENERRHRDALQYRQDWLGKQQQFLDLLLDEEEVDPDQLQDRPQEEELQESQRFEDWLTKEELQNLPPLREQVQEMRQRLGKRLRGKQQQLDERSQEAVQYYRDWWYKLQKQPQFQEWATPNEQQYVREKVEQDAQYYYPQTWDWWQHVQERQQNPQQDPEYRVREPDGTWRTGREIDHAGNSAGYQVHAPDGTWHWGNGTDPAKDSAGYQVHAPDGTRHWGNGTDPDPEPTGYRVRKPDGTWHWSNEEDPAKDSAGYQVHAPDGTRRWGNGTDPAKDSAGYRVRKPDGTWHWGNGADPDPEPTGHRVCPPDGVLMLRPGKPPPGYEPKKSTPELSLVDRRKNAAKTAKQGRDAEHSDRTDDDQSQGR